MTRVIDQEASFILTVKLFSILVLPELAEDEKGEKSLVLPFEASRELS
jgi:hypothetical protein